MPIIGQKPYSNKKRKQLLISKRKLLNLIRRIKFSKRRWAIRRLRLEIQLGLRRRLLTCRINSRCNRRNMRMKRMPCLDVSKI